MGEIIYLPVQHTPEYKTNLWEKLEEAERLAEHYRRKLGMLGIELGVEDDELKY